MTYFHPILLLKVQGNYFPQYEFCHLSLIYCLLRFLKFAQSLENSLILLKTNVFHFLKIAVAKIL